MPAPQADRAPQAASRGPPLLEACEKPPGFRSNHRMRRDGVQGSGFRVQGSGFSFSFRVLVLVRGSRSGSGCWFSFWFEQEREQGTRTGNENCEREREL